MIRHPSYETADWEILETSLPVDALAQSETIMAVANGYLGLRGNLDEGVPATVRGTYLNGVYERHPFTYPEDAYGYARHGETIVNVTDGKIIRLRVDGDPLDIRTGIVHEHRRVLDLRAGVAVRTLDWTAPGGTRVRLESRRMVSFEHRHLAAIAWTVAVDRPAHLEITSGLIANEPEPDAASDDPRTASHLGAVLVPHLADIDGETMLLGHSVRNSGLHIMAAATHHAHPALRAVGDPEISPDRVRITYHVDATPEEPLHLHKLLSYHDAPEESAVRLRADAVASIALARKLEWKGFVESQRRYLERFWARADVVVEGDPELQQAARFAMFQIVQSAARADGRGLPAKGLSGDGYDGQYFWDMEAYVVPPLIFTAPELAADALRYRHHSLGAAKRRAAELSHPGALYPWRTISGEECSAYFPAGTAAYHIDADVAHAVARYVRATDDTALLAKHGAEILVETARFFFSLGFFNPRRDHRFCIHEVTGPDEYSALVDDNTYTNLMAAANFRAAVAALDRLRRDDPEHLERLASRAKLGVDEPADWARAADEMYVPYDDELEVHGQDESFLDREPWPAASIPPGRRPLLLHYHPLEIYRKQIVKQADLVFSMLTCSDAFTIEQKRRNFAYYEPVTTNDSSLSACIMATIAAEIGEIDKAYAYTRTSALMDLLDEEHNVRDGIHIAAQAGTWVALVQGFAGMRDTDAGLAFAPRLPDQIGRLAFSIEFAGARVHVDVTATRTTYTLTEGAALTLRHHGEELTVETGTPRERDTEPGAGAAPVDQVRRS